MPNQLTVTTHDRAEQHRADLRRDVLLIAALTALAVGSIAAYLFTGLTGNIDYALSRRITSVAALVIVAVAIGVSTVAFQTMTANRLLTPSIMGFDSLYLLLQTVVIFALGVTGFAVIDALGQFWLEVAAMLVFSVLLYGWLLSRNTRVTRLLLIGVVFGMLFRGISTFLQRMLDPDAFAVLQTRFFASFTDVPKELVLPAAALTVLGLLIAWFDRRRYDVMSLGVPIATNLGINPAMLRARTLGVVALLVSVSTALVGPVMFFGLIVAQLAYRAVRLSRHELLMPVASLVGVIALVGGQTLVQRVFGLDVALSMIIEFLGGLLFIALILRKKPL
ncbi:enterobactin ABC transporter permease [Gulosibacter macacae]|uniref:Enterobactin ABC transporter permease n=1 Tax=Gulosibacter macacae TaxID=2488791 RepID=A0A3P3VWT1_9MICO|nr:iron chelate uptake ABC transporter family permease subunit [Gulosibacter macacae]RRJ87261.1 enterobactin ABC transporter permease [Gulosibacter macacae]